jgi:hypothetical protein
VLTRWMDGDCTVSVSDETCGQSLLHMCRHRLHIHRPPRYDLILAIVEASDSSAPDIKGLFAISMEPRTLSYFEEQSNGQVVTMACMRDSLDACLDQRHRAL